MIDWNAFDWPTFGSLMQALSGGIVGGLAVLGAYKIGLRQVSIIEAQTEILAKQADIEAKRLTHELYERRYKTYDTALRYVVECVESTDQRPRPEIRDQFIRALGESQFLHDANVTKELVEIRTIVEATYAIRRDMWSYDQGNDAYPEGYAEKERELRSWLRERVRTLPALFSDLVVT